MMITREKSLLLYGLALLFLSGTARADDVHCPPHIGAETIDGNVLVSAHCELNGTVVDGNVLLYAGGSLTARDVRIGGNIQADSANFVDLADSVVDGDIQLDDLVGDLSVLEGNQIGGNIQLTNARFAQEVVSNQVGGDIQAFENYGRLLIRANEVDGNLQCKENLVLPTGGENIVHGNKEDQCADLGSASAPATSSGNSINASQSVLSTSADQPAAAVESSGGGGAVGIGALLMLLAMLGVHRLRWFGRIGGS